MLNSFLTDPVSLHLIRTGLVKTRFHPIFFLGRGVFTSIFEFREIVLMVSFGFCWIFFSECAYWRAGSTHVSIRRCRVLPTRTTAVKN